MVITDQQATAAALAREVERQRVAHIRRVRERLKQLYAERRARQAAKRVAKPKQNATKW
jgi:hypothetical protein